jgi:hypothetical protein
MNTFDSVFWRIRRTRQIYLFAFAVLCFIVSAVPSAAHAGFGITPPYVRSDRLTRGTQYTQQIVLVRSDPQEDLNVQITLNVPGAQPWISVDKGLTFVIPKGVTQMPILVTVQVPKDAAFNRYTGNIRIRTSAATAPSAGGVSIALGAQVDVDIKVVDKIYDFEVRQIRIADLEAGITKWGLFFPGKIRFFMTIQNTGNTLFGPTKVHFDIYDNNGENLLDSADNTNKIQQVDAFATREVLAELPTKLPQGSYVAKYTIYKNADVASQGQLTLSISAPGSVIGYVGYGFDGLSWLDKLKVIAVIGLPVLILIVFITALAMRSRRRRRRKMNGNSQR